MIVSDGNTCAFRPQAGVPGRPMSPMTNPVVPLLRRQSRAGEAAPVLCRRAPERQALPQDPIEPARGS
jgi:hypothetical protein